MEIGLGWRLLRRESLVFVTNDFMIISHVSRQILINLRRISHFTLEIKLRQAKERDLAAGLDNRAM